MTLSVAGDVYLQAMACPTSADCYAVSGEPASSIAGTLTVTPGTLGQASGSVGATLPAILGAAAGTMTFDTFTGSGLATLQVTAPQAELMGLFVLSGVTMTFSPGSDGAETWHVQATASAGGPPPPR
ncbi:MAG: hypothetical protein ACYCU7_00110 [Acidimicrobiales bacterium]